MHEQALMNDLTRTIERTAAQDGADRVTRVVVRLGALAHFTPAAFREHFADATRGTVAEGAEVDAILDRDIRAAHAGDVILESIELEGPGAQEPS